MTANVGNIDRMLRALLGIVLFVSPLLNFPAVWSNAGWAYASMGVGLVLLATALFRFCPAYRIFGISTCQM